MTKKTFSDRSKPTERDLAVLVLLATYTVLSRKQIQLLADYPSDRVARRGIKRLCDCGLIRQQGNYEGADGRAYMLTKQGCEYLAAKFNDDKYLLLPYRLRRPDYTLHYLAVSATNMCLHDAIARQSAVTLERWIGEDQIVNVDEQDRKKHFKLRIDFSEPKRTRCDPDAAFLLGYKSHLVVLYLEQDRGDAINGTPPRALLARKTPGYRILLERKLHRTRHFPETTLDQFRVLSLSPTPARRDQLRRAFRGKTDAVNWRFGSMTNTTAQGWYCRKWSNWRILRPRLFLRRRTWHGCQSDSPGEANAGTLSQTI